MQIDISKVNVRKVEQADVSTMADYRIDYLKELQGDRTEAFKQELKAELVKYFSESIASGTFLAFQAEYKNTVISFGAMIIKRIPGDFDKTSYLEGDILNMYTIPEARRHGVSSLILAALLSEAKLHGLSKVSLHTTQEGESLYRKFGFRDPQYPFMEMIIDLP